MRYCVGINIMFQICLMKRDFFYFSLSSESELNKKICFFLSLIEIILMKDYQKKCLLLIGIYYFVLFLFYNITFFSNFGIFKTSVNPKFCKVFAIHIFAKTFQRDIYEGIFLKGLYLRCFLLLLMSSFLTVSYGSHERTEKSYIA